VAHSIEPSQWEELYREHFPRLYRGLLVVVRDRDRALDALHDAFLEGLRHPPRHEVNLVGWIYRVAIRRVGHQTRPPLTRLLQQPLADDELEQLLARIEVDGLLKSLSERQRAIVIAQYYLGLEQREIAALFRIRLGTVSATLAKAKAKMRAEAHHATC